MMRMGISKPFNPIINMLLTYQLYCKSCSMKRFLLLVFLPIVIKAEAQNIITIDATGGRDTISRYIYGHFAEHLGQCIYGGLYVGENNKAVPNKKGVRLDVLQALKELSVPVLRWPGGCFADTYHWRDGVGPKAERPSILNVWWGNVREDNSFGTNEFLNMCEELGADPYISGNVGSGTPQELADWVKYAIHPNGSSPLTDLRKVNGRDEPWNVPFWGLGNEAWGCGGNMKPDYYANIYRQYATFMTSGGGKKIYRIASGASGDDYNWTKVLMRELPKFLYDALGLHHYSVIDWSNKGSATEFTAQQYFTTMKQTLLFEELISQHIAIMDKYDPEKKKALAVDEWGGWYDSEPGTNPAFLFQQNTMRDAMLAASALNIFNNHADRVKMANLAQMVNVLQAVILTNDTMIIRTPTYHVMEMYKVHHDAMLLPTQVMSDRFTVGQQSLNAINTSASIDRSGEMHISIANIDLEKAQEITLNINGKTFGKLQGRILQSTRIQDYNSFQSPDKIKPTTFSNFVTTGNQVKLKLPPHSVVVLTL